MRTSVRVATVLLVTLTALSCGRDEPLLPGGPSLSSVTADSASPVTYVLDLDALVPPPFLDAQVQRAGGELTASLDKIGVAIATSSDPAFAGRVAKIRGVRTVTEDMMVQWVPQDAEPTMVEVDDLVSVEPASVFGSLESFRPLQWAPDAVSAPAAWTTGAIGAGARVAIVDGGIRDTHIDIAPELDVAHSRSFVPGRPFNFDQRVNPATGVCGLPDTFWHGTHVAGIVAAPANNLGTVGIAPGATIIGVKVLHCGSGFFSWVIQGIYYAATPIAEGGAGADVINMSLGAAFDRQGRGAAALAVALGKATTYAYQRGVTVVAALGNNGFDFDHTNNLVFLPAMSPHVVAVAATGPLGFAVGATDYDRSASYTNFGQSAVDFAAPGGDDVFEPAAQVCTLPRLPSGFVTTNCWVFDLVIAPCRGRDTSNGTYCWADGTSMAAPAVSGVAALIIGKFGRLPPAQVIARLRVSADDLGKPGNDDVYGGGRVNALRAVQ